MVSSIFSARVFRLSSKCSTGRHFSFNTGFPYCAISNNIGRGIIYMLRRLPCAGLVDFYSGRNLSCVNTHRRQRIPNADNDAELRFLSTSSCSLTPGFSFFKASRAAASSFISTSLPFREMADVPRHGQNGPLFRRRSPFHEFRSGYIYLKQGLRLLPLRMDNEKKSAEWSIYQSWGRWAPPCSLLSCGKTAWPCQRWE